MISTMSLLSHLYVPVAQLEQGASNAKILGLNPGEIHTTKMYTLQAGFF